MNLNKITGIDKLFIFSLLLVVPILSTEATMDPNLHIQFSVAALILALYFVYLFFKKAALLESNIFNSITITFLVFIAYSVISLFISKNIADGFFIISKYILWFVVFFVFSQKLNNQHAFKFLMYAFIFLSFLIILPALYQIVQLLANNELVIPIRTYAIKSVFPHRNIFAEMLVLTLPFSFLAIFETTKYAKWLSYFNLIFGVFIIVLLSNRASWLAFSVPVLIILILVLIKDRKLSIFKKNRIHIIGLLVLIGGSIVTLGLLSNKESLEKHVNTTFNIQEGSTKTRYELWSRTIELVKEKPILGHGLESWKINILKFGNEKLESEDNITFYQRPHNDFLWVAAEQGILGLLLYLGLFIYIIVFIVTRYLKNKSGNSDKHLLVFLFITIAYFVIANFSFPKERIGPTIILFSIWGYFIGQFHNSADVSKRSKFIYLFVIALLLICSSIGFSRFISEKNIKNAILAKSTSNFSLCIEFAGQGKSFFYKMDQTSTPIDWYEGISYFNLKDYESAKDCFFKAYDLNPYHIRVINDYASCLVKLNQIDTAISLYYKALDYAPNFLDAKLNLCAVFYKKNQIDLAFEMLKKIDPSTTSERYRKTLRVIFETLIQNAKQQNKISKSFLEYYSKEKNNEIFFRSLINKAINNHLNANEIIN